MKVSDQIKLLKKYMYYGLALAVLAFVFLSWILSRSFITIQPTPADAIVSVDNKPLLVSASGVAKTSVRKGNHTLKVEAEDYLAYIEEFKARGGRTAKRKISLVSNPKPFQIVTESNAVNNVQFISLSDDNTNSIFYFADNASTLYKAKFNKDEANKISIAYNRPISNPPLSGIKDIIWSPKKEAALFKKDSGVYFFDFKKYNFVSQEEVKYGDNIGDIAWSPDDSKIAYYFAPPGGERSLIFANKTNSEMTRVANFAEMGVENPYLSWSPNSEWLIVIPRNKDFASNKIYLFNAYTRSFKTIVESGSNIDAKFSPSGQIIVYSSYSNDPSNPVKANLSVMDLDGNNKTSLNLRAFAKKTVWKSGSDSQLIIATYDPETKNEAIFGYNVDNKKKDGFQISLSQKINVKELLVSQDNSLLFYIAESTFFIANINN